MAAPKGEANHGSQEHGLSSGRLNIQAQKDFSLEEPMMSSEETILKKSRQSGQKASLNTINKNTAFTSKTAQYLNTHI